MTVPHVGVLSHHPAVAVLTTLLAKTTVVNVTTIDAIVTVLEVLMTETAR